MKNSNIKWHDARISKNDRWLKNGHGSALIWLTGLPASGKSTIAAELEHKLFLSNINTFVLDGDNIRHGLNRDIGFSETDRRENLRRVGEVAKLFVNAGILTIAAFISPYKVDRERIRSLFDEGEFIEVYVKCDVATCEARDPKGHYKSARAGTISDFTGISAPYEPSDAPDIIVETDKISVEESITIILNYLKKKHLFQKSI